MASQTLQIPRTLSRAPGTSGHRRHLVEFASPRIEVPRAALPGSPGNYEVGYERLGIAVGENDPEPRLREFIGQASGTERFRGENVLREKISDRLAGLVPRNFYGLYFDFSNFGNADPLRVELATALMIFELEHLRGHMLHFEKHRGTPSASPVPPAVLVLFAAKAARFGSRDSSSKEAMKIAGGHISRYLLQVDFDILTEASQSRQQYDYFCQSPSIYLLAANALDSSEVARKVLLDDAVPCLAGEQRPNWKEDVFQPRRYLEHLDAELLWLDLAERTLVLDKALALMRTSGRQETASRIVDVLAAATREPDLADEAIYIIEHSRQVKRLFNRSYEWTHY